jgi:Tol biopolymer transport system component
MKTDGSALRRIAQVPGFRKHGSPRWSHDGKLLAFLRSGEKDGRPAPAQINILRLDGGEPRAITSLSRGVESIAWSPTSNTIAFTATTKPDDLDEKKKKDDEHESDVRVINQAVYRFNGAGYRDASRTQHIWTIDVRDDETKPKQLTTTEFGEGNVTWSPDGTRIFYTSTPVLESYYDVPSNVLYAIPAAGGEPQRIASYDGSINAYAVSPDGKWVAFAGSLGHPVQSHTKNDLFVVSATPGSQPRDLTKSFNGEINGGGIGGDQGAPAAIRRGSWTPGPRARSVEARRPAAGATVSSG